jgi:hypothetical protein
MVQEESDAQRVDCFELHVRNTKSPWCCYVGLLIDLVETDDSCGSSV